MDKYIELLEYIKELVLDCADGYEASEVIELAISKLKESLEEVW